MQRAWKLPPNVPKLCYVQVMCTPLCLHMDKHSVLTRFIHGFRSKHICELQLMLTTHDLLARADRGEKVDVDMDMLDFSKAFNTMPHLCLLHKLKLLAFTGSFIHRTLHECSAIFFSTPVLTGSPLWIPPHSDMAGCWQINSILANIGRRNSTLILNQYPSYEIY